MTGKKLSLFEIIVGLSSIVACIAAVLVVPDFRQWAGLEPSNPPETATTVLAPATVSPTSSPWPLEIYDDFNDKKFDGKYNEDLWDLWLGSPDQIEQGNGVLMLASPIGQQGETGLSFRKYPTWKLQQRSYFEAKLKLSSHAYAGNIGLKMFVYLPGGDWATQCIIEGSQGKPYVGCGADNYYTEWKLTDLEVWHTVGIEIDPNSVMLTYYIDGQLAGSTVPEAANELREASWLTAIGAWTPKGETVVGYVDDVRIDFMGDQ